MNSFVRSAMIRRLKLNMTLVATLCIFLVSFNAVAANPDTTWSVSFQLNMTKAVNQHIFVPDSDYVYLVMDSIQPLRLVAGPGYNYTATLFDQLDSGVTYHYKFRINDSVWESVNRTVTAQPGMVSVSAWWNDEPVNYTAFIVNMKYAVQYSLFNPSTDSVCIVGTMNNMQGSPKMSRIDTSFNYSIVYSLDPGSVQQFKYRINQGDSAAGQVELLFKPNRIVRIPDTLLEVTSDYNNYNPAKRLMTFQCDMGYYAKAHHFDPASDYLDVAGNFNGDGANDALFDTDGDTIYSLGLYMDTAWIHQGPLAFRFRINGDPATAELEGKPGRTYAFHDTINHNPNIFGCYYNNLDPAVPTPPWVYNVGIQGVSVYKKFLSGVYAYENVNGIPEGISTYRWLRSSNAQGTGATPIDSATKITYVVDTLDIGLWLVFEVTPVAAGGDSAVGKPVSVMSDQISAWDVGMDEHSLITRVYPNPAGDYIAVEAKKEIDRIVVINYLNQVVLSRDEIGSNKIRLSIGNLPGGIYLLKATTKNTDWGIVRVVKY
jgi:hypothetical protein